MCRSRAADMASIPTPGFIIFSSFESPTALSPILASSFCCSVTDSRSRPIAGKKNSACLWSSDFLHDMWIDYVVEWNNIHLMEKKEDPKRATQVDYDAF